jgi:hypothetical protein
MFRIAPENLLWALENLVDGHVVNQIKVDDETREVGETSPGSDAPDSLDALYERKSETTEHTEQTEHTESR